MQLGALTTIQAWNENHQNVSDHFFHVGSLLSMFVVGNKKLHIRRIDLVFLLADEILHINFYPNI